jgi:hypothetical protein
MAHPALLPSYRGIIGICLAEPLAMYLFFLNSFYRVPLGLPEMVMNASEKMPRRSHSAGIRIEEMLFYLQTLTLAYAVGPDFCSGLLS